MSHTFVLRRCLGVLPTVAGIVIIGFVLVHIAPGDPIVALAGEHGDQAYYAFMRERFGLDRSLWQQLGTWIVRVFQGDLGTSYVYGRSAVAVIAERIPATALLTGTALCFAIGVAVPIGTLSARHDDNGRDIGVTTAALTIYSAPTFWIGQLALLVFALWLGVLPVQGMTNAGAAQGSLALFMDVARHLLLPAWVLAAHEAAVLMRVTRTAVIEELRKDYVRTARAKGAGERTVLFRHALPRALLPVFTVIGTRLGHLLSGAVVVEIVFGWPGLGRLLLSALQSRDIPIVLAMFMMTSFAVVLANLATDLLYSTRDPRIRLR